MTSITFVAERFGISLYRRRTSETRIWCSSLFLCHFAGKAPAEVYAKEHQAWHFQLFEPCVRAGIIKASDWWVIVLSAMAWFSLKVNAALVQTMVASEGVSTPERVGGVIVIGKNLTRRRRYNRLNYNNTATKTDNAARLHFIDQVQKTICAFLISPSAGCLD